LLPEEGGRDAWTLVLLVGCCCPTAGVGHHFPDQTTDGSSTDLDRTIQSLGHQTGHLTDPENVPYDLKKMHGWTLQKNFHWQQENSVGLGAFYF